jgi:hypothetical protein
MNSWGAGAFENDFALVLLADLAHWNRDVEHGHGPEWVIRQLRILFRMEPGAGPAGINRAAWSPDGRSGYEEPGAGDAHRCTISALVIASALRGAGPGGDHLDLQDLAGNLPSGIRPAVVDRILRVQRPAGQVSDWRETAVEHCDLIRYEDAIQLLPAVVTYLKSRRAAVPVAGGAATGFYQAEIGSMLAAAEFCATVAVD